MKLTIEDLYKPCPNCGRMIDNVEDYCDRCKEELKDCSKIKGDDKI